MDRHIAAIFYYSPHSKSNNLTDSLTIIFGTLALLLIGVYGKLPYIRTSVRLPGQTRNADHVTSHIVIFLKKIVSFIFGNQPLVSETHKYTSVCDAATAPASQFCSENVCFSTTVPQAAFLLADFR